MEETHTFKLIDGIFNESDARNVLLTIVSAKIQFHSLQNFSNTIRFGNAPIQSENRLNELKELDKDLRELFDTAKEKGLKFKILSTIKIDFINDAPEDN